MAGDLDVHKISSVQNFRSLGAVKAYNAYNGVGRDFVRKGKGGKEKKRKKSTLGDF